MLPRRMIRRFFISQKNAAASPVTPVHDEASQIYFFHLFLPLPKRSWLHGFFPAALAICFLTTSFWASTMYPRLSVFQTLPSTTAFVGTLVVLLLIKAFLGSFDFLRMPIFCTHFSLLPLSFSSKFLVQFLTHNILRRASSFTVTQTQKCFLQKLVRCSELALSFFESFPTISFFFLDYFFGLAHYLRHCFRSHVNCF